MCGVKCPRCNRVGEWDPEEVPEYCCRYCEIRFAEPKETTCNSDLSRTTSS
jgi:hypothetical protein